MDIIQAICERTSVRVFKSTPVPHDLIEEVLQAASQAPSAINLQPWEYVAVSGEEKARLSRRLLKAYREKQISCAPDTRKPLPAAISQRSSGSSQGISDYVNKMGLDFHKFVDEGSCNFYGAPSAILICIDDAFASTTDIGITLGYLLLAAHSYGLATCPIGLIASYQDGIKELLDIPENKKIVVGVALGYADAEHPINRYKSPRENLSKLVRWIE